MIRVDVAKKFSVIPYNIVALSVLTRADIGGDKSRNILTSSRWTTDKLFTFHTYIPSLSYNP